jgi:hypothetical protein
MAFSDPQTITINAVANSLPRVGSGVGVGTFAKDDQTVVLGIAQRRTPKGRMQARARLDHKKIAPDPFNGALNASYGLSVTIAVDHEMSGYTLAEKKQVVDGLLTFLTASSGANILRLLGGES